nr:hypothetical protein [Tanacetum cinerariifolium]
MAVPGAENQIASRVINDLVDFGGETVVPKYMKFFIGQQIVEGHRFINRMREEPPTSRNLIAQDDRRGENAKLIGLNELITQADEEIEVKEAHVQMMEAARNFG